MVYYRFRDLESTSHFRILYLDAGADDEQLSGSLVHHNLDEHPTYDCLSYVWGCPTRSHSALLDGTSFPITANLYSALKRIRARSSNGRIAIWADGICINQDNIPERSQQVNLMRRIYSECQTGLLYLGEAADGSDLLPDFLETLQQSMDDYLKKLNRPVTLEFGHIYAFPEDTHPGWEILRAFLQRPWFRRVWIVQEFALPPQIRMICGQWEMPGMFLAILLDYPIWKCCPLVYDHFKGESAHAVMIHRLHLAVRVAAERDLGSDVNPHSKTLLDVHVESRFLESPLWLLNWSHLFLATDPRDKIFALLPLSSDTGDSDLTADYSKPTRTVTAEVAQHLVRCGYGLSLLRDASSPRFPTGSSSWYSDWMSSELSPSPSIWLSRSEKVTTCQIFSNLGTQAITVIGSVIDIVQDKSILVGLLTGKENKWIKEIDALVGGIQTYPTGCPVNEAVWRTLVADQSVNKRSPAPEWYGIAYRECRGIINIYDPRTTDRMSHYGSSILKGYGFSITRRKLFSMLPQEAEVDDSIFLIKGDPEKTTFLVRKDPIKDQYRLIGQAYVHGIWNVLEFDELEDISIIIC